MESLTGNCEKETGGRRGIFLTIMSLTIAVSALLSGYLIGDHDPEFTLAYLTAAVLLVPFLAIASRSFTRSPWITVSNYHFANAFKRLRRDVNVRSVLAAHFILQLFFAWMVVYTPVYLSVHMGFDWEMIGQILFVGLMAYVFLEYIVGLIADNWFGEKEMMALGFLIIAVSTSWFVFLTPETLGLWMIAMFVTRVGASLVEATTESYFFKHTNGNDATLISFFRITRPLSMVVGSLLGMFTLWFVDNQMHLLFVILGLLMIPGFFFTMQLKDTR
jgi:predicted MFS family arabinose efflux permease